MMILDSPDFEILARCTPLQAKKPRLCSVVVSTQEVVEHERSVGENTEQSRGFFICIKITNPFISPRMHLNFQTKLYLPSE